jgi:hypothetical protein
MTKSLISFLFVFFLQGKGDAYSQTGGDSTLSSSVNDSAVTGTNITEDMRYEDSAKYSLPILDTGVLSAYPVRKVDQRTVNTYLKNPDYAYANDPEYWRVETTNSQGGFSKLISSRSFRWLLFILISGVLLYGIIQLARENNFKWLVRKKDFNHSDNHELKEEKAIDFNAAIHAYQQEGNYRLAVRCMYLKLIHDIRENGSIAIRDSSTNAEIAFALKEHQNANEFRYLATAYEYIYYGDFIPEESFFNKLKEKFDDFQLKLSV